MTYRQQLDQLVREAGLNPPKEQRKELLAKMIATSLVMQWEDGGGEKQVDANAVYDTTVKLMNQKAFKELVKDPLAIRLAQQSNHLGLIQLMDQKETEIRISREAYNRPQERVRSDAAFLRDAADALKNGSAKGRPAELEKKSRIYQEMIRRVEAAQQKTEQGVQLTAAENKALVSSIKKYINGGTNVAGGPKKAPHFKEAMCVLKEYMPKHEFDQYCGQINARHPSYKIDPNSFVYERMVSKVQTAEELRQEAKRELAVGFSEDACAKLLAANNLSAGNSQALLTPEQIEKEKASLMTGGSAFRRAMSSENARTMFKNLAAQGKAPELGRMIEMASKMHAIGAAQYRLNRSVKALTEGPLNQFFASQHLASVMVAHDFASKAGPTTVINKQTFDKAVEEMQKDSAFQTLAQRYATDPSFRQRMNKDLTLDKTGSILALEMHHIKNPRPQRQVQPQDPQQQQAIHP